jgi:hypothetical protein
VSTIRLLKDDARGKKGEVVSVPFGVGQTMVAAKVGEYPAAPKPAPAPAAAATPPAERHAQEIARLNALHAAALAEVKEEAAAEAKRAAKEHAAEVAKLKADLDAAQALIAEQNAKKK